MGSTVVPKSLDSQGREVTDEVATATASKLDAGALFVLKSKGTWLHCGYHLTTSIVGPALLSLPFALASLGWAPGVLSLTIGFLITFYSYNLLSHVLEYHAQLGRRQLRFRDMAEDILGPGWGRYYVGPIQFLVCFGAVIGSTLLGGQTMKLMYLISTPNGTEKLYIFVIIFGAFMLFLAQIPSFHSLRHLNLVSLLLCLAYSSCTTAASIYAGHSSRAPNRDYSLLGDKENRAFGAFNAIAIIATTYGNGIIPEIQATVAPPVKGKMFKGLCLCYAVVISTFFTVSISGYWAFGNLADGTILTNFIADDGSTLVPKWFLMMTNVFTLLQLSAVGVTLMEDLPVALSDVLESEGSHHEPRRLPTRRVRGRSRRGGRSLPLGWSEEMHPSPSVNALRGLSTARGVLRWVEEALGAKPTVIGVAVGGLDQAHRYIVEAADRIALLDAELREVERRAE